ncbi:MAG: hypothetical protein FJ086_19810, partial [Deltaproteobacteria bacterium]|nr:hypothetical protein [Deltaproteobacteria bacterium]
MSTPPCASGSHREPGRRRVSAAGSAPASSISWSFAAAPMASRTTSAAIPASGSTTSRNTPSVVSPAASGPVRPSRRANTPCAGMNNTAVKAPSSAGAANGWTTQK